jgi:hypothetical protein
VSRIFFLVFLLKLDYLVADHLNLRRYVPGDFGALRLMRVIGKFHAQAP